MVATIQGPVLSETVASNERYRIGMWVALAAILMMFTSLSSAYIVRAASANDWRPIAMPRVLLLSTALIVISSLTLETARRKLKRDLTSSYKGWLLVSTLLGVGFLLSQLWAWRQLVRQGIYVVTNPHSSFFYLLTGTHGVHLIGGLLALMFLLVRARNYMMNEPSRARHQAVAEAVTVYWHFMDVLWIYLFVLLFFWR
ncbi:MAG TPA: cytochrome c oxidase subunit 3 [Pyrinomonadaceae bacterium]|nr:cytochrome c oxidase subunit 3 [Pyrinomonadaceae bacterium]